MSLTFLLHQDCDQCFQPNHKHTWSVHAYPKRKHRILNISKEAEQSKEQSLKVRELKKEECPIKKKYIFVESTSL